MVKLMEMYNGGEAPHANKTGFPKEYEFATFLGSKFSLYSDYASPLRMGDKDPQGAFKIS